MGQRGKETDGRRRGGGRELMRRQQVRDLFCSVTDRPVDRLQQRERGEEARATLRLLSRGAGHVAVMLTGAGRSRLGWTSTFSARCAVCDAH